MFFEVKKSSSSSRFFSQIAPLSSLEEAVEPEVFHSQIFKQTNQNCFLVIPKNSLDMSLTPGRQAKTDSRKDHRWSAKRMRKCFGRSDSGPRLDFRLLENQSADDIQAQCWRSDKRRRYEVTDRAGVLTVPAVRMLRNVLMRFHSHLKLVEVCYLHDAHRHHCQQENQSGYDFILSHLFGGEFSDCSCKMQQCCKLFN